MPTLLHVGKPRDLLVLVKIRSGLVPEALFILAFEVLFDDWHDRRLDPFVIEVVPVHSVEEGVVQNLSNPIGPESLFRLGC